MKYFQVTILFKNFRSYCWSLVAWLFVNVLVYLYLRRVRKSARQTRPRSLADSLSPPAVDKHRYNIINISILVESATARWVETCWVEYGRRDL